LARSDLKGQDGAWWEVVMLFNPRDGNVPFMLPERADGAAWTVELNTADGEVSRGPLQVAGAVEMPARTLMLLR
jgi:glycogen operon protein